MKEIEVKIKSTKQEHERVAKQLVKLGFKKIKSVNEMNILYEHPSIPLKSIGNVLRVRHADKTTMTFKGKKFQNKNGLKIREEFEVEFSEGKEIENILTALGFKPGMVIKKKRTMYRKATTEVDLDILPALGYFIEIEGTETAILKTLKALNLETKERLTQGYAQLIREARQ
jgi:predicted adenylyl cyclase CyaB